MRLENVGFFFVLLRRCLCPLMWQLSCKDSHGNSPISPISSNAIPARLLDTLNFHAILTFIHRWSKLISGGLEMFGESDNDRGGVSGDLSFTVDADNDGQLRGGNGNAVSTLYRTLA